MVKAQTPTLTTWTKAHRIWFWSCIVGVSFVVAFIVSMLISSGKKPCLQEQDTKACNCSKQRASSSKWAVSFRFWAAPEPVFCKFWILNSPFSIYVSLPFYSLCWMWEPLTLSFTCWWPWHFLQDQDQLRSVTESILISLVVPCSGHAPRAEFLLFALRSLCSIGYINWDTFLPSLLSSVSSAEMSVGQGNQAVTSVSSTSLSPSGMLPSSSTIHNSSTFQSSNPASPLPSVHGISSPAQSATDPSPCVALSPVKSSDISCSGQQSTMRVNSTIRDNTLSCLRQLCCKIILTGLDFNLKPVTYAEIFNHMLNWLVNWDQRQQESDVAKSWRPDKALIEWLHSCLDVIWLLVEEDKCRVPFYELLRSGLQFIENIPDDEALFTLILEIHRRRDMMAMHMQMLDQHLQCPTFGTHRFLSQTTSPISGEAVANLRYSPIMYPSVLGEPLHGEVTKFLVTCCVNMIM